MCALLSSLRYQCKNLFRWQSNSLEIVFLFGQKHQNKRSKAKWIAAMRYSSPDEWLNGFKKLSLEIALHAFQPVGVNSTLNLREHHCD